MKERWKERLRKFMEGRYGVDELNRFLTLCGWVLLLGGFVLSLFNNRVTWIIGTVMVTLSWAFLVLGLMRSLSRKTSQRASENYKYFVYKNRATGWFRRLKTRWADRKEHKYFRCPQCRATVRVPRGKGKIRITCPRCKNTFIKKS